MMKWRRYMGDAQRTVVVGEPSDKLARYRSGTELRLMRQLKAALDPKGLFNPGKVLATDQ